MSENNSSILDKIRALFSMTEDAGCTEQEALSAAEMARKLMLKYNIGMSELEIKKSKCTGRSRSHLRAQKHESFNLIPIVSEFTDTKGFIVRFATNNRRGINVCFFGLEADVEYAHYLIAMFGNCMEIEWQKYKNTNSIDVHGKAARTSFMLGMTNRLHERIKEMINKNKFEAGPQGGSLIVLKNQVVTDEWAAQNIELKQTPRRNVVVVHDQYQAGLNAANNISIAPGLKTETSKAKIA